MSSPFRLALLILAVLLFLVAALVPQPQSPRKPSPAGAGCVRRRLHRTMTSHTHTQRPLVSDINSETWRLALTVRAAQELREAALYGPQPPPSPAARVYWAVLPFPPYPHFRPFSGPGPDPRF
jgi:hypothetical protein